MFAALGPALKRWKREGLVTSAWFVRKPPDIRLRLSSSGLDALAPGLHALLDGAVHRGTLVDWFPSPYEPERVQLGGDTATELAHGWFDADTRAYLSRRVFPSAVPDAALTLLVLTDLFRKTTGDRAEAWDCWCNFARIHEGTDWITALNRTPEAFPMPTLSARDRVVFHHYQRANDTLARGLDAAWRRGELLYGQRTIVPYIALFHWNRLGLPTPDRRRVYRFMVAATDPKVGMVGCTP